MSQIGVKKEEDQVSLETSVAFLENNGALVTGLCNVRSQISR